MISDAWPCQAILGHLARRFSTWCLERCPYATDEPIPHTTRGRAKFANARRDLHRSLKQSKPRTERSCSGGPRLITQLYNDEKPTFRHALDRADGLKFRRKCTELVRLCPRCPSLPNVHAKSIEWGPPTGPCSDFATPVGPMLRAGIAGNRKLSLICGAFSTAFWMGS